MNESDLLYILLMDKSILKITVHNNLNVQFIELSKTNHLGSYLELSKYQYKALT